MSAPVQEPPAPPTATLDDGLPSPTWSRKALLNPAPEPELEPVASPGAPPAPDGSEGYGALETHSSGPSEETEGRGSEARRAKAHRTARWAVPAVLGLMILFSPLGAAGLGSFASSLPGGSHVLGGGSLPFLPGSPAPSGPGGPSSPSPSPSPSPAPGTNPVSSHAAAVAGCPNSNFYNAPTTLTLQAVVDCALAAGFTGPVAVTFVSMAYQESGFNPAAIEPGPHAEGVLQEGTGGQTPPQGGPFPLSDYSPSSCPAWSGSSSDWGGIYFDPACAFQWAIAYYQVNGYNFWGSYLSGAYCTWAPAGFAGTGPVACSGLNQNQAGLPWSSVCPNNSCGAGTSTSGYNGGAAAAYATQYMGVVGSDGYYWVSSSGDAWFPQGTSTPAVVAQYGSIGDDCTHFASLALEAGGLSIPTVVPPAYGNPSVTGLRAYLLSNNLATDATGTSLPSWLVPGDLILYQWAGTGTWDHTAVYLGNGLVAEHSYGNGAGSVVTTPQAWNNPGGGAVLFDFIHITGNSGGGGAPAPPCPNLAGAGGSSAIAPALASTSRPSLSSLSGSGYWLVGADGGVFSYGNAGFYGSASSLTLGGCIVGMAATPDGHGYWLVGSDGGVLSYGDAGFFGSMGGKSLNAPVVGIAPTPNGQGYWLVAADGGVFSFGNAGFFGSMGGKTLNAPVVGMAATPTGQGYWLVAADGGVFAFGNAGFFGSMGGNSLNAPVVGIASTPNGQGYWLAASDGGVFSFGSAQFYGSMGGKTLNAPVQGITAAPDGQGYWLVAKDGGVFSFGSAAFLGSMGGQSLNAGMVGMAVVPPPPAWSLSAAATPASGYAPLAVAFTAKVSGGAGSYQYLWDLGNGATSSVANPSATYSAGVYTATLTVTSSLTGLSKKATVQVDSIATSGYWMVGADGGVFSFGNASFAGSAAGTSLNAPIVGMAVAPHGSGYWLVGSDGGVFSFGSAGFFGSMGGKTLNAPVVGIAATPNGQGYWLAAADGGIFAFGNAPYLGSLPGDGVSVHDIVGIVATPSGGGYWLVGADGGVFAFGNAPYLGSLPGSHVSVSDVVAMASTPSGQGYWLVGADGSVWTFGDATNLGSMAGHTLNKPIVGIAVVPGGTGYELFGADGGVFTFGSAVFYGGLAGTTLNAPIVGGSAVP